MPGAGKAAIQMDMRWASKTNERELDRFCLDVCDGAAVPAGYLVLWWGLCGKTERCCAGLQALLCERMKHWRWPLFPMKGIPN